MHSKTKHFDLDIHFVRDSIKQKQLHLTHIPRTTQIANILTKIANILTKSLSASSFHSFRNKLMVVLNPTINLRRNIS